MAFLTGYTKRKKITIDNTNVDSALSDFPVLVKLDDDADIGADIDSNGYNIRFTSSDGETLLDYDRRSFDNTGSEATGVFFARVPSVASSAATDIYLYYKAASPSDGEDKAGVWQDYAGVWHLDEASGNAVDAKGASDLTETSGTIGTAGGQIANARDFEAGDTEYFVSPSLTATFKVGNVDCTMSAICNAESLGADRSIASIIQNQYYQSFTLQYDNTASRFKATGRTTGTTEVHAVANTFGAPSTGTAYLLHGTHHAGDDLVGVSVNGGALDTASLSGGLYNPNNSLMQIGAFRNFDSNQRYWDGLIEEVRFRKSYLSAAWRKFEYHNIFEADNELTFSSEETEGGGGAGAARRRRLICAGAH